MEAPPAVRLSVPCRRPGPQAVQRPGKRVAGRSRGYSSHYVKRLRDRRMCCRAELEEDTRL